MTPKGASPLEWSPAVRTFVRFFSRMSTPMCLQIGKSREITSAAVHLTNVLFWRLVIFLVLVIAVSIRLIVAKQRLDWNSFSRWLWSWSWWSHVAPERPATLTHRHTHTDTIAFCVKAWQYYISVISTAQQGATCQYCPTRMDIFLFSLRVGRSLELLLVVTYRVLILKETHTPLSRPFFISPLQLLDSCRYGSKELIEK